MTEPTTPQLPWESRPRTKTVCLADVRQCRSTGGVGKAHSAGVATAGMVPVTVVVGRRMPVIALPKPDADGGRVVDDELGAGRRRSRRSSRR